MKWCSGPCGRLLPRDQFYKNGKGYPQGPCKACHRMDVRKSQRQTRTRLKRNRKQRAKYANDAKYREHRRYQALAWYHAVGAARRKQA